MISGLIVAAAALVGLALRPMLIRCERNWILKLAGPFAATERSTSAVDSTHGSMVLPEDLRRLCPPPPFTAFVFHPTCSSCRTLWRELQNEGWAESLVLAYEGGKESVLMRLGALREPSIALPQALSDDLPSGLVITINRNWGIVDAVIAGAVDEVKAAVARSRELSQG